MALIHQAELRPTKLEALERWLPSQPWAESAIRGPLERVGAFRFDDPDGEVGIETLLVRGGDGPVLQVPLTYRGAPLAGAEGSLVCTMDHSVLGQRWAYDGCADPVAVQAVLTAILTGGHQAEEVVDVDGKLEPREASVVVSGSGTPETSVPAVMRVAARSGVRDTIVDAGVATLVVRRVLDDLATGDAAAPALRGRWSSSMDEVVLVTA